MKAGALETYRDHAAPTSSVKRQRVVVWMDSPIGLGGAFLRVAAIAAATLADAGLDHRPPEYSVCAFVLATTIVLEIEGWLAIAFATLVAAFGGSAAAFLEDHFTLSRFAGGVLIPVTFVVLLVGYNLAPAACRRWIGGRAWRYDVLFAPLVTAVVGALFWATGPRLDGEVACGALLVSAAISFFFRWLVLPYASPDSE